MNISLETSNDALEKGNWELFDYTFLSRSPSGVTFSLGKHSTIFLDVPQMMSHTLALDI